MAVIEAIATTYLEADAASVTFSGIPSTYEHLQVRYSCRSSRSAQVLDWMYCRLNGDSASNYAAKIMSGKGSAASAQAVTSRSYAFPTLVAATLVDATEYSSTVLDVLDYANTNKNTTLSGLHVMNLTATTQNYVRFFSGLWISTAAVSSISFELAMGNLVRGSEFTLYGLNSA